MGNSDRRESCDRAAGCQGQHDLQRRHFENQGAVHRGDFPAYARLALFGISAFIADEDMRVDEFKDWANGLFVVEPAENIGADKESAK